MPKKKKLILVIVSFAVLLFVILIYSNNTFHSSATGPTVNKGNPIDVDKIVESPEKFTGFVDVEGKVKEVIGNKKLFTLGCEDDEDASIPVLYNGELPGLKRNVIVTGEIKKDENGKYFFEAKDVNYK